MPRLVEIENSWLRASVLPAVGGKVYDLIWKPTGRNWLWHNPRIAPHPYLIEGNFDNHWCGGWDDAFPTCDDCTYQGETYPALGELRSVEWSVDSADQRSVQLSAFGPINPVRARKTVALDGDKPVLRMTFEITNIGFKPIDFIWGTHPALAVSAGSLVNIPAQAGLVSIAPDARSGEPGQRYSWPHLTTPQGTMDMSRVLPAESCLLFGHYALELQAGWYAVEDAASGTGIVFQFSRRLLPNLWMWINYGGWRGYHHLIVEPWTSCPVNLPKAVQEGTARTLQPGETFTAEIKACLYAQPTGREAAMAL
jgi:galactose mutarotase-like enzyme